MYSFAFKKTMKEYKLYKLFSNSSNNKKLYKTLTMNTESIKKMLYPYIMKGKNNEKIFRNLKFIPCLYFSLLTTNF